VAVHVAGRVHQAAVGSLLLDQVSQARRDLLPILALQLSMPGAQQGQQHHAGGAVQRIDVRAGNATAATHAVMISQLLIETP